MYRIVKDGAELALIEAPSYVRQAGNGCFVLCDIIDRMNVILQAQAMELAQLHALHHEEEIAAVRRDYAQAIGEVST